MALLQDGDLQGGYAPCTACGDTEMLIHVIVTTPEQELVWASCATCEKRGGSWYRKRQT